MSSGGGEPAVQQPVHEVAARLLLGPLDAAQPQHLGADDRRGLLDQHPVLGEVVRMRVVALLQQQDPAVVPAAQHDRRDDAGEIAVAEPRSRRPAGAGPRRRLPRCPARRPARRRREPGRRGSTARGCRCSSAASWPWLSKTATGRCDIRDIWLHSAVELGARGRAARRAPGAPSARSAARASRGPGSGRPPAG